MEKDKLVEPEPHKEIRLYRAICRVHADFEVIGDSQTVSDLVREHLYAHRDHPTTVQGGLNVIYKYPFGKKIINQNEL